MKILKLVAFLTFPFVIMSCSNVEKNPPIELPTELKGCLISTELFNDEWSWEDSRLSIKESEPSSTNQYQSSVVVSQIARLTKDEAHRFNFATGLVTYDKPITFGFSLVDGIPPSSQEVEFHPSFPPISGNMKYFCDVTTINGKYYGYGCQMQILYTYHVFNMTHWGNTFVDNKTLEDFLNPLLIQFDQCIVDLEK